MAVEKQIWEASILEGKIPDTAFLGRGENKDECVEFNTINLQEAGVDPEVYIDKKEDIGVVQRVDIPYQLALHTFDTQNTLVKNIEAKEASYAKVESVVRSHKNALLRKKSAFAAQNWSPSQNSDFNPVLVATGAVGVTGYKALTFEDVLLLESKYLMLDVELDGLNLVLHPYHLADLMAQDMKLYKAMLDGRKIFGFNQFKFTKTPIFNSTTGVKKAMGAVAAATDAISSFSFLDSEVMRATGTVEVFIKENCPITRGDTMGFQQRFTALPLRNKYMGAIYSAKA